MSKGGSPPPPVDPNALTQAQTTSGIDTAIAQMMMNMQNKTGPFGSTTYNQTGSTMVDGVQVPTYGQTTTLSPQLQNLFNSGFGNAQSLMGNINTSAMPNPQQFDQNTINALYGQATSRLNPQFAQGQNQMYDKLAQQGITPGSQAYNTAVQNFNRGKNDAYTSAMNSAVGAGVSDAGQLWNQQLQAKNEPMQQLAQLMSIMGGSPMPQAGASPQVSITPPNVLGDYSLQQQGLWNNYNAQQAASQAQMGGMESLASMAMLAFLIH